MTPAVIVSLLAHTVFVVLLSAGFFFSSDIEQISETPITVEFATGVPPTEEEPEEEEPEEITEPEPLEDIPQPAPKALEQPKPAPEKAEENQEAAPIERIEAKPVEKEPEPEPEPKPIPEKPEPKPEPPEKVEEKEPEEPKEENTEAEFTSVLKNLADTQPTDTAREGPKLTETPTTDRLTTGELNAFRRQLSRCWNILPGATNADMMAVNLTITVNQDRTVRDVQITDAARYQSDPLFRAAADSAMRAIRHPDCTPLDLPLYKYEQWKTITLNFDPRTMF